MWGARTGGPVGGTQGPSEREGTDSWATSYSTSPHTLGREHSVGAGTKKVPGATLTPMHWETRQSQWEGSGSGPGV